MRAVAILFALVAFAAVADATAITAPKSVAFDNHLLQGTNDMPLYLPPLVKVVAGIAPEQIHITYASPSAVIISWVTGNAQIGAGFTPLNPQAVESVVAYGTQTNNYTMAAEGYSIVYNQTYNTPMTLNYTSGIIHHVRLNGLKPSTKYYYVVGDPFLGVLSDEFAFTTLPPLGPTYAKPLKLAVFADHGDTYNSSDTLSHLIGNNPDMALLIGDLVYADDHYSLNDGVFGAPAVVKGQLSPRPALATTYQPRWDGYSRFTQSLAAFVPLNTIGGNHEIEPQTDGTKFKSYESRYPSPYKDSNSTSPEFYSFEVTGIHIIFLSSYVPYEQGSAQYTWFLNDLKTIDRSRTPWVMVGFHAPWYNSYVSHYMENECMRPIYEPLFYAAGVDMVVHGHVHAYERTNPVNNFTVDPCGPVYFTLGDAGNIEGAVITFSDTPGLCPGPNRTAPSYQPQLCFPPAPNYCPSAQPAWSAYREPSFGHGIFTFFNASTAQFDWHRNQDGIPVIADTAILTRDLSCPNKALNNPGLGVSSIAG